jgi:hypothetical protein
MAKRMFKVRTYMMISLFILLLVGLTAIFNISQATKTAGIASQITTAEYSGMNPYIQFTGHQLVIMNKNDFDWTNVQFKLVAELPARAPMPELDKSHEVVIRLPRLRARSTFTVAAGELGDDRLWQMQTGFSKPYQMTIQCNTPRGACAWSGRWE